MSREPRRGLWFASNERETYRPPPSQTAESRRVDLRSVLVGAAPSRRCIDTQVERRSRRPFARLVDDKSASATARAEYEILKGIPPVVRIDRTWDNDVVPPVYAVPKRGIKSENSHYRRSFMRLSFLRVSIRAYPSRFWPHH